MESAKVIWLTGLPSSGKTTLATSLAHTLRQRGAKVEHLDGDAIREVFPQTGFDRTSRHDHICRVGYLASRLEHHGIWSVVSLVSPYRESRNFARRLCSNFFEIYLSTPIEVCKARDSKGLYRLFSEGKIQNLTGADGEYEAPLKPEYVFDTSQTSPEFCTQKIIKDLFRGPLHNEKIFGAKTNLAQEL